MSKASAWSEAKRLGKHFIPNGDASVAYERLALGLRKIGFFIVEVGELEGFCRTVGKHGPAWLLGAFEFDLDTAPELNEAREFVRDLTANW